MKKTILLLAVMAVSVLSFAQDGKGSVPEGPIHHFNFNGVLTDAVTKTPLMKLKVETKDSLRKVSYDKSTTRLAESDVEWVEDDGAKTAIRMLPMEFATDLSTKTHPQLTISLRVRVNKSDIEAYHSEERGGFSRSAKFLTWLESGRYKDEGYFSSRRFKAELNGEGEMEAYDSGKNGTKTMMPVDAWTWLTVVWDVDSARAIYYLGDKAEEATIDTVIVDRKQTDNTARICFASNVHGMEHGDISELIVWDRVLTPEEVASLHGVEAFAEVTFYDRFGILVNIVLALVVFSLVVWIWRPLHFRKYTRVGGLGDEAKAEAAIAEAERLFTDEKSETRIYPWPVGFMKIHSRIKTAIKAEPNDEVLKERLNSLITDHNDCMAYRYSGSAYVVLGVIVALVIKVLFDWFTNSHINMEFVLDEHVPMLLGLLAYIVVSYGWSFASLHGKPMPAVGTRKSQLIGWESALQATGNVGGAILMIALASVKVLFSVIGEALANSTEVIKVYVNGVFQGVRTVANPAGCLGPIIAIGCIAGVLFLIAYLASILILLAIIIIVPVKFIRVHVLHI